LSITFIVPTIGRPSLARTIASIETRPGDEVLLVGASELRLREYAFIAERPDVRVIDCPPGGDYGHTERNVAMRMAKGDYLSSMDDDDEYAPGARAILESAMNGAPSIFRMQYFNVHGPTLWRDKEIRVGNCGTPCVFTPNVPERLAPWGNHYCGDFDFMIGMKWEPHEISWREEVIALIRPE
jgi:hypothetical protein